uniref:COS41.3 n=1 Tax=Phallusia mammillata TaxID=59560 RepID=A0A6F9DWR0_9ASCI|nr:COS41.3 [Phallusia mammillata]
MAEEAGMSKSSEDALDETFKTLEEIFTQLNIPKSKQVAYMSYHLPIPMYKELCSFTMCPHVLTLDQLRKERKTNEKFLLGLLAVPYHEKKLYPYDKETNVWDFLFDQFSVYFMVHDIPKEDEMTIIEEYLPAEAVEELYEHTKPLKFNEITFALLKHRVKKTVFYTAEITISGKTLKKRHEFFKRNQYYNETLSEYYEALSNLSMQCEFGIRINEHLRDRFTFGIHDPQLRNICLNWPVPPPTGADVVTCAKRVQDTLKAKAEKRTAERTKKLKRDENRCYRCGKFGHYAHECKFVFTKCKYCSKRGHIQAACRQLKNDLALGDESYTKQETSTEEL